MAKGKRQGKKETKEFNQDSMTEIAAQTITNYQMEIRKQRMAFEELLKVTDAYRVLDAFYELAEYKLKEQNKEFFEKI